MISTDLAIDIKNVQKTYRGKVHALRGIAMHVRKGEVYGLLGPNGAGKSTLVKIIMTVVRPTVVDGKVLGAPVGDKPTLARIGYLPENHRFPRYLTGRQVLDLFSALSGLPRKGRLSRADELLEIVGMSAWGDRKIGTYSKGMMQRVGLAQAMMHNPDLILLDEPTDGVDPVGRKEIRDVLLRLKQQGVSVLINSHLLSELEMISDRVGIIVNGMVARQGTLEELSLGRGHFEIQIAGALPSFTKLPDGATAIGDVVRIDTTDAAAIQPWIDLLRANAVTIVAVRLIRPTLEQLFMEAVMEQTGGVSYLAGGNPGRGFPVGVRA
jgi:ABC-2 type transport system ATP-binding protein